MTQGFFVSSAPSYLNDYILDENTLASPMWISFELLSTSVSTYDPTTELDSDPAAFDMDDEDALSISVVSLDSLQSLDADNDDLPMITDVRSQLSRAFPCTYSGCPNSFVTKADMMMHLQGHGFNAFPCTLCGLVYHKQCDRLQHQKSVHGLLTHGM
jgi:hypothetical protein